MPDFLPGSTNAMRVAEQEDLAPLLAWSAVQQQHLDDLLNSYVAPQDHADDNDILTASAKTPRLADQQAAHALTSISSSVVPGANTSFTSCLDACKDPCYDEFCNVSCHLDKSCSFAQQAPCPDICKGDVCERDDCNVNANCSLGTAPPPFSDLSAASLQALDVGVGSTKIETGKQDATSACYNPRCTDDATSNLLNCDGSTCALPPCYSCNFDTVCPPPPKRQRSIPPFSSSPRAPQYLSAQTSFYPNTSTMSSQDVGTFPGMEPPQMLTAATTPESGTATPSVFTLTDFSADDGFDFSLHQATTVPNFDTLFSSSLETSYLNYPPIVAKSNTLPAFEAPATESRCLWQVDPAGIVCGQVFEDGAALHQHILGAHLSLNRPKVAPPLKKDSNFNCAWQGCKRAESGRGFEQTQHIKDHIATHAAYKPISCPHCPKTFKDQKELRQHMATHTGEKRFACNQCDAKFGHAASLKTHLRKHAGLKPYICDICGHRDADSANFRRHMDTHKPARYVCEDCQRPFCKASNLARHRRSGCRGRRKMSMASSTATL